MCVHVCIYLFGTHTADFQSRISHVKRWFCLSIHVKLFTYFLFHMFDNYARNRLLFVLFYRVDRSIDRSIGIALSKCKHILLQLPQMIHATFGYCYSPSIWFSSCPQIVKALFRGIYQTIFYLLISIHVKLS